MKKSLLLLILFVSFFSCDKDEPIQETEPETNYIDKNNYSKLNKGVISIDPNENITSINSNSITITTNTLDILNLKKGQIIVSGHPNKTLNKGNNKNNNTRKKGFLRKITDISVNGNEVVIQTEYAKLEDAFEQIEINTKPLLDLDNFSPINTEYINLNYDINNQKFDLKVIAFDEDENLSTINDQIIYKSSFRILENRSKLTIHAGLFITKPVFDFTNDFTIEYINEVHFKDELEFEKELTVAEIPLFINLPKNLSVSLNLEIKIGMRGKVSAELVLGNKTTIKATNQLRYLNNKWDYFPKPDQVDAIIVNSEPYINGNVSIEPTTYLSTGLEIEFFDNEEARAGLYLKPYLQFSGVYDNTLTPSFSWEYGYGIDLTAEAKLQTAVNFINFDYNTNIWEKPYSKIYQYPEDPIITTNDISEIKSTSIISGGAIFNETNDEIIAKGVCWSTNNNPIIDDNKINNGTGYENFTSNVNNLLSNTKYYLRAYIQTNKNTFYGEEKEFTTLVALQKPTVSTNNITDITQISAKSGGNVENDGGTIITERGIVWSTNTNPTTGDNKIIDTQNTSGTFSSFIENLTPNTTYYLKAYATNSEGTSYGEEKEFKTLGLTTPLVLLSPLNGATEILNNTPSVLSWSEVKWTNGNSDPIAYDFYFGTTPNPPKISFIPPGYTSPVDLSTTPNTTYYWKIVARDGSSNEVTSSDVWSFKTRDTNIYQGNWNGIYTGNQDNGSWDINVDQNGIITGTATSYIFNNTYEMNGNVQEDGSLNITVGVGTSSSGATFEGTMTINTVSGTWNNTNTNMYGNWSGNKQ